MSSKAAAILLSLAAVACGMRPSSIPILGDYPVKIGSPPVLLLGQVRPVPRGKAERHNRLLELFEEAGCDQLENRWRRSSELPHVVCTFPGDSDSRILVTANFQPLGGRSPDNWAGAAMLPSLYRSVRVAPRRHTYEFVGFANEGRGRPESPAASALMVRALPEEERAGIVAMVSLRGLRLDFPAVWKTQADPNLHLDLYSVSRSIDVPVRHVDFNARRREKWRVPQPIRAPNLGIPSILIGVADLGVGEYLDSYRLVAAYLSYLDQTLVLRKQLQEDMESAERPASG